MASGAVARVILCRLTTIWLSKTFAIVFANVIAKAAKENILNSSTSLDAIIVLIHASSLCQYLRRPCKRGMKLTTRTRMKLVPVLCKHPLSVIGSLSLSNCIVYRITNLFIIQPIHSYVSFMHTLYDVIQGDFYAITRFERKGASMCMFISNAKNWMCFQSFQMSLGLSNISKLPQFWEKMLRNWVTLKFLNFH